MIKVNAPICPKLTKPLFSFGVITDVQYADIPDGHSFMGVPRYYRHSLLVLQRAVRKWNYQNTLKFVLNFGDIIDGKCPREESLQALESVVNEFDQFTGPTYHMLGNHCLYNLPRSTLVDFLKIPALTEAAYFDFSPSPGFRVVVLDGYDVSPLGRPVDHESSVAGRKLLEERNPNTEKNSPLGLTGLARRFLMFNGGVGKSQLSWLDEVLEKSTERGEKVIMCCHVPLHPGCTSEEALLWNYDEVLEVIHKHTCVKVCFAGHNHADGYCVDSGGVHHRVFEPALECPPGRDAFGHVEVYDDRVSVVGVDLMESMDLFFLR